jgi:2-isopropylmalate synthase
MQVEYRSVLYYGFSGSTDIVTASVEAFIDAMSQIV